MNIRNLKSRFANQESVQLYKKIQFKNLIVTEKDLATGVITLDPSGMIITEKYSPALHIPPETILLKFDGNCVRAFWLQESFHYATVEKSQLTEIIGKLPAVNESSNDSELIHAVNSIYECDKVILLDLIHKYFDENMDKEKCHEASIKLNSSTTIHYIKDPWNFVSRHIKTLIESNPDDHIKYILSAFQTIRESTIKQSTLLHLFGLEIQFYVFIGFYNHCEVLLDKWVNFLLNKEKSEHDIDLWTDLNLHKAIYLMCKGRFREANSAMEIAYNNHSKYAQPSQETDIVTTMFQDIKNAIKEQKALRQQNTVSMISLWNNQNDHASQESAKPRPVQNPLKLFHYREVKSFWEDHCATSLNVGSPYISGGKFRSGLGD